MNLFPSFRMRRDTLALGLCLLAALFALEAKIAWYGPAHGPGVDVSCQKAYRVNLPSVVDSGSTFHPVHALPLAFLMLALIGSSARRGTRLFRGSDVAAGRVRVSSAAYFSSALFFRPPPAL